MDREFTRLQLFELVKESPDWLLDDKLNQMENRVAEILQCPDGQRGNLRQTLSYFKSDFKKKWAASNHKEDRFLKKNEIWLEGTVKFQNISVSSRNTPGRPLLDFNQLSERSKRRKTEELRHNVSSEQLTYAASMSLRAAGNSDAADLINKITVTPTRAKKIKDTITSSEKSTVKKHTPSEALALLVEADLTKRQYEIIQSANKNIYPCYSLVKQAKKECYPREDMIDISETSAEIKLQALLDHTSSRLCLYLTEVINILSEDERQNLELICKWGCDGSKQSQFKQKFQCPTDNDCNIFQSCLVPLRLISKNEGRVVIVWQNPTPSSPRFCRPIRIRFIQESSDVTTAEMQYIENQVDNLSPTKMLTDRGAEISVKHTLLPTMVDGKVCNAMLDNTSTVRCYICNETSKDFNNLSNSFTENVDALKFGLSTLHARIRFFESLLHLSYKLPLKKWQVKTPEEKQTVIDRKKEIQSAFKAELGLLVDIPKQGFGNTNDGNTSRRFFENYEVASRITGVDCTLIKRLKITLEAICSGFDLDIAKFQQYTNDTAKLYVELYGWYPMTPTLHKVLMHGATVIKHALLPIGQLSEEASEARNKHFRLYREKYSRKFNREVCNRDVLNRLLLSSDPYLSCSRKRPKTKRNAFSSETLDLFASTKPLSSMQVDGKDEEPTEEDDESDPHDSESD